MALTNAAHCSPPRVPQWQLSAWPERDPDCRECGPNGDAPAPDPAYEKALEQLIGSPTPVNAGDVQLQKQNQRMMHILADRSQADQRARHTCKVTEERRKTFQLFQTVVRSDQVMYAFDLPMALEACKLPVDDQQAAIIRRKFNLQPGDQLGFDTFNAACDLVEAGIVPPDPQSPPREHPPPCPGSPQYQAGKKEKELKPEKPPKNPVPYHKVMDSKVQVPPKVRVRHGF